MVSHGGSQTHWAWWDLYYDGTPLRSTHCRHFVPSPDPNKRLQELMELWEGYYTVRAVGVVIYLYSRYVHNYVAFDIYMQLIMLSIRSS